MVEINILLAKEVDINNINVEVNIAVKILLWKKWRFPSPLWNKTKWLGKNSPPPKKKNLMVVPLFPYVANIERFSNNNMDTYFLHVYILHFVAYFNSNFYLSTFLIFYIFT